MTTWERAVLDACECIAACSDDATFSRRDLIRRHLAEMVERTRSAGATPEQTLSRVLQTLRDQGHLTFLGDGKYRLEPNPADRFVDDSCQLHSHASLRCPALPSDINPRTLNAALAGVVAYGAALTFVAAAYHGLL